MRAKGNGSLGQALLRYVKSMQSLHFPLAFQTTTGFANHVGCNTPLTNLVASKFLTSSTMNCCLYKACLCTFCLTGQACGQIVMTHKYRGSIIVLSISKSVEPNEEQKEMINGFQQGILCKY